MATLRWVQRATLGVGLAAGLLGGATRLRAQEPVPSPTRPPPDTLTGPPTSGPPRSPVPLGSRVRVWAPTERDRSVLATRGRLLVWTPDTLVLADEDHSDIPVAIPYAVVRRVDLSRGIQPRPNGARTGAMRGLFIGLSLVPLVVFEGRHAGDGFTQYGRSTARWGALLGVEGAAIGAFLGATLLHTRWEPVLVPEHW
ncbi:MAG: hypothetical protein NVS1B4_21820 [Gemmatimonadaceae bacterium]